MVGPLGKTYQGPEGFKDSHGGAFGQARRADCEGPKKACCIGARGLGCCRGGAIGRGIDAQEIVETVLSVRGEYAMVINVTWTFILPMMTRKMPRNVSLNSCV